MNDIETELGLDKSILAAQFSLESMIQRFREAETPIPLGLLSQIMGLQDALGQAFEHRHPGCDSDVRAGLVVYGLEEVLEDAEEVCRLNEEYSCCQ
jgi:hypothetical protein